MSTNFAEALTPLSSRMPRVVREHEVLRVAGWMPGDEPDAVARQAEVLQWAQRQVGARLPPAAWEGETFDLPLPGRDPSAIRLRSGASDLWTLRMNRSDKDVPGRAWTTEVVLGHLPGKQNAPSGEDTFEFDWNGRRFPTEWHVVDGGRTRDPVRCLRIYYCFDPQTQQIIVADMPAHRRSGAT
jgi:hypothetical protein